MNETTQENDGGATVEDILEAEFPDSRPVSSEAVRAVLRALFSRIDALEAAQPASQQPKDDDGNPWWRRIMFRRPL